MKKFIAWFLVLALTAAVSIGTTLAYLTDTDEDVNVMTLGKVKIDQLEYERVDTETADEDATVQEFHDNKPLYPAITDDGFDYETGDTYVNWEQIGKDGYTSEIWDPSKINNEVDKMVFVKNKGTYDAYVRTVFAFEAGNYENLDQFWEMVHLNLNNTDWTWEWAETPVQIGESKYFIATATYNKVLQPGAYTEISLSQISLDKTATNADVEAFGDTYQVLVKSQGIQADGFADAATALDEGFGVIDADNVPWENDAPTKGTTLKRALHCLNGDVNGTRITSKVTNVVFGLNSEYPAIVDNYDGTLVDVEQDVPAYAYYVKNGSAYDVYVLSNDTIYAPENSKGLFANMTSLKTVKGNLDTSRTTTMESFFDYCGALQSVDCADWDTGKVASMKYMFYGCGSLTELDVSGWDLGNAEILNQLFYGCKKLTSVDVSDWDVSNVKDFQYVFGACSSLKEVDLSKWNTGNATTIRCLFYNCTALTDANLSNWKPGSASGTGTALDWLFGNCSNLTNVNLSGWDTSKVTKMNNMFYGCKALTEVDMANWDVSKVTTLEGMFAECRNLLSADMTNWQPSSVTTLYSMFYECKKLQSADMKGWYMPELTTASHLFRGCNAMTSVDVTGWHTPKLTSMDAMFHTCSSLTEIDVSDIDTANCVEFSQLFEYSTSLQHIKGLENWDTGNAKTFEQTFSGCSALKELDLSSFNTRSVVNAQPMQNNATGHGFSEMFSAMGGLEKLVLSADFSFDGDGKVTTPANKVSLPSPAAKTGFTAMWRNVETGELYLASEIPEETAATYVAHYVENT